MIHGLANRVAYVFLRRGVIQPQNHDIYTYALETILSETVNVLVCLMISLLFGRPLEGIVFTVTFAMLRKFTGGHHAQSHWQCISTFAGIVAAVLTVLLVVPQGMYTWVTLTASAVSMFPIVLWAPVTHENKPLSEESCVLLKRKSRFIGCLTGMIAVGGVVLLGKPVFLAISLAGASVGGSMAYATLSAVSKHLVEYGAYVWNPTLTIN
jgi:accessory gene regulator B